MLPNQQQSQEPRGEAAAASKEEKVQEEAKPKVMRWSNPALAVLRISSRMVALEI